MNGAHIYVIGNEWSGPVKIGVAVNPEKRADTLQSGNHAELRVLWQSGRIAEPYAVEKALHLHYAEWLLRGEWFHVPNFTAEEIAAAVDEAIASGARSNVRTRDGMEDTCLACAEAIKVLVDRRRYLLRLSIDEAIDRVAADLGLGWRTIWALRYRPPKDVSVGTYITIADAVYTELGRPAPGMSDVPEALLLRLVVSQLAHATESVPALGVAAGQIHTIGQEGEA